MKKVFSVLMLLFYSDLFAQVGIGTNNPNPSAKLEVSSTNQGFLPPRVALTATNIASPVTSPAIGLLVYNSAAAGTTPNNVIPGFYYWNGSHWVNLTGNGVPYTGAMGSVNLGAFDLTLNGLKIGLGGGAVYTNTTIGDAAMLANTSGTNNTATGFAALNANTTGSQNTGLGYGALAANISGGYNTGVGRHALNANTLGEKNSAIGVGALEFNTAGTENTAIGFLSLLRNTTGSYNTSSGVGSLQENSTGLNNTSSGYLTLHDNTIGSYNSGYGSAALAKNTTGGSNSSIGYFSLFYNTTGSYNTAFGTGSLVTNSTGSSLSAVGHDADVTVDGLTNATVIGQGAKVSTSNTVSLGNSSVTSWAFGIPTTSVGNALEVGNNSSNGNGAYLTKGGSWTNASSRDFKEDFEEINEEELISRINKLSIKKWKYKNTNETHIGPIAEEFKDNFDLGLKEDNKHISTLDVSGIALKAIQILYKQNQDLKRQIEDLKTHLQSK